MLRPRLLSLVDELLDVLDLVQLGLLLDALATSVAVPCRCRSALLPFAVRPLPAVAVGGGGRSSSSSHGRVGVLDAGSSSYSSAAVAEDVLAVDHDPVGRQPARPCGWPSASAKSSPRRSRMRILSAKLVQHVHQLRAGLAPLKLGGRPRASCRPVSRISSVVPSRPRSMQRLRASRRSFRTYSLCFLRVTRYSGGWATKTWPVVDQRLHVAEEEGQQQRADVAAVHVGVGHDDDLAVAAAWSGRTPRRRCRSPGPR